MERMETTLEATVVSSKKVRAVFLTIFHVVLVYNPSNTSLNILHLLQIDFIHSSQTRPLGMDG